MKRLTLLIILCGITVTGQEQPLAPEVKITGFSHPESVIYDDGSEYFYVSNMADRTEGDGFISRISRKWKKQEHHWVKGLNDPKGLVVKDDRLYVTDVTVLVEIDLETGEILRRIPVEGAKSLNDPVMNEKGEIYFSDLAGNSIYKLNEGGEVVTWLNSPDLEKPNGLFVTPDHLLVAAWGEEQNGNILKIDRSTKEISKISRKGIGNMDGIQPKASEEYFVSDWATGNIYSIDMKGNLTKVLTSAKSSGDILYLEDEKKLYLPMNHQNELWIYSLK
ncbi:SMP-30/gluconolactonase/LRE family protein [Salinimicrobium sp. CAU 1759]